ncbi:hypothetical protein BJF79_01385 [Actinomadura sp. CNU-125]|nr:hypothetical protein BJF79_01385 [Actinomadura sp. CNU-125]
MPQQTAVHVRPAASFLQQCSALCTAVRALPLQHLRRQRLFEFRMRANERRMHVAGREPQHGRQFRDREPVPYMQIQNVLRDRRKCLHGIPGDEPLIDIFLVMARNGRIGRAVFRRRPARALQARNGVQPGPEPCGVTEFVDVRFRRDESVAQSDLSIVPRLRTEPAVGVQPVGIGAVDRGRRVRFPHPQRLDQFLVVHD